MAHYFVSLLSILGKNIPEHLGPIQVRVHTQLASLVQVLLQHNLTLRQYQLICLHHVQDTVNQYNTKGSI